MIVSKIGDTLLNDVPRCHGLWPHFVGVSNGTISIKADTEWSSVDTVIAAIGLLDAQNALGMNTSTTEQMLDMIDWEDLAVPDAGIPHGYNHDCTAKLNSVWDTFGGESWLVELAYASATGQVTDLTYDSPPTANGSGFIDELAWPFVLPPSKPDIWGNNWDGYREEAANAQISYYSKNYPDSCFSQLGLFGLSAGEVPDPSLVAKEEIYQAFGVGGHFASANDGTDLYPDASPVVVPHYSAMIASLRPEQSIGMWNWLITNGFFSPLMNTESLMFPADSSCDAANVKFNHLKGSLQFFVANPWVGKLFSTTKYRNTVPTNGYYQELFSTWRIYPFGARSHFSWF